MRRATADDLRSSDLLAALPQDALDELAARARVNQFHAGAPLFDRGDPGRSLHIVVDGLVEIHRGLDDPTVLDRVGPGEHFGELVVFDPAPRSAAAVAVADSVTIEVDRDVLEAVLTERPGAAMRVLGAVSRSLTRSKEQVTLFNKFLDAKVRERTEEVRETQLEVIRRLGRAAEYKDEDTGAHIFRMSNYAAALARQIGFDEDRAETLLNAAPMHDVGKIGIPDRILLKPAKLDEDEWEIMKAHTIMGANMLTGSRSQVIQLASRIALTHHERWDGRGYPNGLRGEEIPIEARVCCIADVFDALTSERPYKKAWTFDDALTEIESLKGAAFDPSLVDTFTALRPDLEEIRQRSRSIETAAQAVLATVEELAAQEAPVT